MPQDYVNLPAAIAPASAVETYRTSTNAADLCGSIVKATAKDIQGRKYVCVEGWQAIAIAHGCAATSCDVERVEGGVRATGQVRRMDTGAVIAEAEGFVGEDEPVWFGGEGISFGKRKTYQKRPDFAIRAMAQTRAISRACRSAFAHVVVLIDKDLGTTPAEEMMGVIDHEPSEPKQQHQPGPVGSAAGGTDLRPERRQMPAQSSAHGRELAQQEPGLVDHERQKGKLPATNPQDAGGQTKAEQRATKLKTATDKRVNALKSVTGWTRATLDQFWADNKDWIDWMADPANKALTEYERFSAAFADAEVNMRETA